LPAWSRLSSAAIRSLGIAKPTPELCSDEANEPSVAIWPAIPNLPDDSRGAGRAVGEGDLHGRGAVDHVLLRDDVTAAVDDEP